MKRTSLIRRALFTLFRAGMIAAVAFMQAVPARAQVSPLNVVTYQGRILNANGVPVPDALLGMQFRLFDDVAAGTCLWSNDSSTCASNADQSVTLTDGLFSENLGDTGAGYAAIPDSVFADNASVFLEVEVAGETLAPRKPMTAAPYALNAQTLDGLDSSDFLTTANAFIDGGNSFGADATLGTNDGFALNFETNGTTRLTVDTSGNVTPANNAAQALGDATHRWSELFLDGGAFTQLHMGAAGDEASFFYDTSDNSLNFAVGGGVQATINDVGNFGIGTTGPDLALALGPSYSLLFEGTTDDAFDTILNVVDPTADRNITFQDASGTVAFLSDITGGTETLQQAYDADADGGDATVTTNGTDGDLVIAGNQDFRVTSTGDSIFDTTTLVVDSSANSVGVGTATPADLFAVGAGSPFTIDSNGQITSVVPGNAFDATSSTAAGTAMQLFDDSLTSGVGFNISSASTALTGDLMKISLTGSNVSNIGNLLNLNNSGVNSIAKALNVTVSSTGAFTNGGVRFNFQGAHTGNGFQFNDATATGTGQAIIVNALTSGTGLSVASSSTAMTGNLGSITLSGNSASNTGKLFSLASSGASSAAVLLNLSNAGTGNDVTASNWSVTQGGLITTAGDVAVNGGDVTSTGALTVTPGSGANLNVSLATTGDFTINTNDFYVDTSSAFVGINTTSPDARLNVEDANNAEFIRLTTAADSAGIFAGPGSPNGSVTAQAGSVFLDESGTAWVNTDGATAWSDMTAGGGGGANTALSNLSAVAINTSLLPAANDSIDLGDDTHRWANLFLGADTLHIGTSTADEGAVAYDTALNNLNFSNNGTTELTLGPTTSDIVTVTGGTLASTKRAFVVNGTLSSAATTQLGARFDISTQSGATSTRGLAAVLNAGATPTQSIGFIADNSVAGTGTTPITSSLANFGIFGAADATTSGHNVGILGSANGGARNIGLYGQTTSLSGNPNAAVVGVSKNSGVRVGGYFMIDGSGNEPPINASAGLVADNGDDTAAIFLGRDNGSTVFTIADGGNVTATGDLAVNGDDITSDGSLVITSATASTYTTAAGNISFQPAGAGTANVQIGTGVASTTPDLLVMDLKSNAGDPTGTNGAMYYSNNTNSFRCFENGSWKDCDTGAASTSLQDAYDNGATITTSGATDIAFTLTSGNFTASGAGSVSLTPTAASTFTSGGALTLTGGAASTWGTSAGNLSLQVAGTGTTANVQIGAGGGGSTTPDLLVVDTKSNAGDPTAVDGAVYYNGNTGVFRIAEGGVWKTVCNKTDQGCGAGTGSALSAITAAVSGNSISNGDNAQVWNWTLTTAGKTAFTFGEDTAATNGVGNQSIVDITTLSTSTASPLRVTSGGTANTSINLASTGDFVIQDAGATFATFSDAGLITFSGNLDATNGVDVTGANLTVGGANFSVTTAGLVTTADDVAVNGGDVTSTGALRLTSATSNAITVDSGSTGAVNLGTGASAKTVTIGNTTGATAVNIDTGTGGINFGDNANTKTIDIGGVTNSGTDTINVATESTAADVITIGNANASTTLALTGGDDWNMAATGVLTMSASAAQTTALVVTDTDYTNALSIGDNNILGTTAAIDFTNFDVSTGGNVTVAAGVGLDTNAAGALAVGNANATSVSACNSAACDTLSLGTNADADAINIGDSTDTVTVRGTTITIGNAADTGVSITDNNWNVSTAGAANFPSIGGVTPGTAAFTTLSSTGTTTLGNNSATVAIDSTSWDVSSAGAISGLTGFSQSSGAFSSTLTTTNSATFASTTANADTLSLKPQTTTATATFDGQITTANLTANRAWTFPDTTGTVALTSDLGSFANTSLSNLSAVAINTSLLPGTNDSIDLGDNTHRWANLFLGGETLHIGASTTDEGTMSYNSTTNVLTIDTDSTSSGNIGVGTGASAKTVTIGNTTGATGVTVSVGTGALDLGNGGTDHSTTLGSGSGSSQLQINSGTSGGTYSTAAATGPGLTFTANSISSGVGLSLSATGLTSGAATRFTSTSNTASATAWSANEFNPTNGQGTTANTSAGVDINYRQNTSIAGNTETALRVDVISNTSATTDQTVANIIEVVNSDTATGNQITATNGLLISGSNVTNGINLSGTFGTNLITSTNFVVSQAGNTTMGNLTINGSTIDSDASVITNNNLVFESFPDDTPSAYRISDASNNPYLLISTDHTSPTQGLINFGPGQAPTVASANTAEFTTAVFTPPTITLTGTTSVTNQMDTILFNQPTITDASAVAVTDAANVTVAGGPIEAGSVSLTNSYAIRVIAGAVGSPTNSYGLFVDAQTGATNNYAAVFNTGLVGIGTSAPTSQLTVSGTTPASVGTSTGTAATDTLGVLGVTGGTTTIGTTGTGGEGSDINLTTGTGGVASSAATSSTGGGGGDFTLTGGTGGGATTIGTTRTGGGGGTFTLTAGSGGTGSGGTTNNGGAGGSFTISAGTGGTGTTAGGDGGVLTLNGGNGGSTGGDGGNIVLNAGASNGAGTAGQVILSDGGSSTITSLAWNGDPDTGLFHAAAGVIDFAVDGTTSIALGDTEMDLQTTDGLRLNFNQTATIAGVCHSGTDSDTTAVNRFLVVCSNTPNDIAEMYETTGAEAPADIVVATPSTITYTADAVDALSGTISGTDTLTASVLAKSSSAYQDKMIGVVSTSPAQVYGRGVIPVASHPQPIAVTGRVPVKVSGENGSIQPGDPITSSSIAGTGMKATQPGMIIGYALDAFTGPGTGSILLYVEPTFHMGNVIAQGPTGNATSGTPGMDSFGLAFRGSGWDGAAAQSVAMTLVNDVTSASSYKLSIRNSSDAEVAYVTDDGAISVSSDVIVGGKLFPSAQGVAQTDKYIFYGGAGDDYMRTNASGWGTGSYDFAEMFPSADALQPGDVVAFDTAGGERMKKATLGDKTRLAGIVSTKPGFVAGDMKAGDHAIALAGRVPVKVSAENGAIAVGDALTVSASRPGYAMKATEAGMIVGYALEAASSDTSVTAFVHLGYWPGTGSQPNAGTSNGASNLNGNLTALNMSGNIYMGGNQILNVGAIAGLNGSWSVDATGTLKTQGLVKTVIESYQNEKVETAAVTSPDVTISLVGTATLVNGEAVVNFDEVSPTFNDVTSTTAPVRVLVTPNGPVSLYVVSKDHNGFTVREVGGIDSDVTFDWMVSAYRKDYEPAAPAPAEETAPPTDEPPADEVAPPAEEPPADAPAEDPSTPPSDDGSAQDDAVASPPASPDAPPADPTPTPDEPPAPTESAP